MCLGLGVLAVLSFLKIPICVHKIVLINSLKTIIVDNIHLELILT
jgi:hypothetical protein